jgi:hypothetical protein
MRKGLLLLFTLGLLALALPATGGGLVSIWRLFFAPAFVLGLP